MPRLEHWLRERGERVEVSPIGRSPRSRSPHRRTTVAVAQRMEAQRMSHHARLVPHPRALDATQVAAFFAPRRPAGQGHRAPDPTTHQALPVGSALTWRRAAWTTCSWIPLTPRDAPTQASPHHTLVAPTGTDTSTEHPRVSGDVGRDMWHAPSEAATLRPGYASLLLQADPGDKILAPDIPPGNTPEASELDRLLWACPHCGHEVVAHSRQRMIAQRHAHTTAISQGDTIQCTPGGSHSGGPGQWASPPPTWWVEAPCSMQALSRIGATQSPRGASMAARRPPGAKAPPHRPASPGTSHGDESREPLSK